MPERRTAGRWRACAALALMAVGVASACTGNLAEPPVIVGSKAFTEGVILGEVLTAVLHDAGVPAVHRRQLGGTRIVWEALVSGEIDLYVEYTGTLVQEILRQGVSNALEPGREPGVRQSPAPGEENATPRDVLAERVARFGVRLGPELGFSNSYALGMLEDVARRAGIRTISDLRQHPEIRLGLSNEFLDRQDGWPGLRQAYGLLETPVRGFQHDLAYQALAAGRIQVTDLYSTDAEIPYYGLRVLRDDRAYFPQYRAVVLLREQAVRAHPGIEGAISRLSGRITERGMAAMNAAVKLRSRSEREVAASFLEQELGLSAPAIASSWWTAVGHRTLEHLSLVLVSLLAAVAVAMPAGVLAARRPALAGSILALTGILQTIPSLALLVLMIPVLGVGAPPAIGALFLYSLLPIVRNTVTGLQNISPALLESADALGLPRRARLRYVELPLAAPMILAGIKIAAVINVGTATLGALIGAGGYGQPILAGIRLNDTGLILQGALPAAALALLVQGLFELAERRVVSPGLRR